ncbi:MAG: hypothetical protein DDT19_01128 [Syntrophomonadaceae bacterium]|nr:hypothetical protein [Bacillota bacterium]
MSFGWKLKKLSQDITVITNGVPAVCTVGAPLLPEDVPQLSDCPGRSTSSLFEVLGCTGTAAELCPIKPEALALTVQPVSFLVISVTTNVVEPLVKTLAEGSVSFGSEVVRSTDGSNAEFLFHQLSQAMTVTSNATPAVLVDGCPSLP